MTKHDLKEMRNIGAELGAAKAEVERLREALRPFATFEAVRSKQGGCTPKRGTVWAVASAGEDAEITVEHLQAAVAALSQQAEPVRGPGTEDTASMDSNSAQEQFTAVDMATAAAQGFRDGQAAVEQATAQDERSPGRLLPTADIEAIARNVHGECSRLPGSTFQNSAHNAILYALERIARPAQTEQQPAGDGAPPCWWIDHGSHGQITQRQDEAGKALAEGKRVVRYTAAPIAQTAPQHPDDEAVDRFAVAMKAKLAASREKGRHGWQNATAPHLSALLYDHLYKADPLDVGNLAMMLHQNGQAIELPQEARGRKQTVPQPEQSGLVEALADAAQSLETISNGAGKDEFMQDMADVRGYARSRAGVARAALSAQGAGDASA